MWWQNIKCLLLTISCMTCFVKRIHVLCIYWLHVCGARLCLCIHSQLGELDAGRLGVSLEWKESQFHPPRHGSPPQRTWLCVLPAEELSICEHAHKLTHIYLMCLACTLNIQFSVWLIETENINGFDLPQLLICQCTCYIAEDQLFHWAEKVYCVFTLACLFHSFKRHSWITPFLGTKECSHLLSNYHVS